MSGVPALFKHWASKALLMGVSIPVMGDGQHVMCGMVGSDEVHGEASKGAGGLLFQQDRPGRAERAPSTGLSA